MGIRPDHAAEQARRDLERLAVDRDTFGSSALARMAQHFRVDQESEDDPIERWGKRIGRVLGAIFFVILLGGLLVQVLSR